MIFKSKRYQETGPFRRIWQAFNALHDDLRHMEPHSSPTVRVHRKTSFGYTLEAAQGKKGGVAGEDGEPLLKRFQIRDLPNLGNSNGTPFSGIKNSYLFCYEYDADGVLLDNAGWKAQGEGFDDGNGPHDVWIVARPPNLRRVADTFVIQSEVPNAPYTGVYELSLPYAAGDDIYALRPVGATGVGFEGELMFGFPDVRTFAGQYRDTGGAAVLWMDANLDGRHWRLKREPTQVCKPGVTKELVYQAFEPSFQHFRPQDEGEWFPERDL